MRIKLIVSGSDPVKSLLWFLICIFLFSFTSSFYHESSLITAGEQFWIKTTTTSLTIDWNSKRVAQNPGMDIKIQCKKDGDLLWQGNIKGIQVGSVIRFQVNELTPKSWAPSSPELYQLEFSLTDGGKLVQNSSYRIGFRDFETRDGRIYLNGKPIFLRGIAINPPGRGIPTEVETSREFATDYIRFLKSINVNIVRIPDNSTWYEVCDEEGMMVFGGNYSVAIAGARIPKIYDDGVRWFKEQKFAPFVHHPSLMIYSLTNEVPFRGEIAQQWVDFLDYTYENLREWDPTRLYIGNAGYGYGKSGDICDLHRYWGWYYSSPYTYLHIRDYDSITFPDKIQPLTFTECVGNYTGPDGRYNLTPNHKNPVSQKKWTGHARAFEQQLLADEHQSWVFKEATELMRRLRRINTESSGVFPFTIMFRNWHTISRFTDMDPKAVNWQARTSFQPVLLSWENWTPQVYAGSTIHPIAHVVNDDDNFSDLRNNLLVVRLLDKALSRMYVDSISIPDISYYDIYSHRLSIPLPDNLFTGYYSLEGIVVSSGREVSRNQEKIFIGSASFAGSPDNPNVILYDPAGKTSNALHNLGYRTLDFDNPRMLNKAKLLVIGENAADKHLHNNAGAINNFIERGGRVLLFKQNALHQGFISGILPVSVSFPQMDIDNPSYPPPNRPSGNSYSINPERPDHPIFSGLTRSEFRMWSDFTSWDETQTGLPMIYPVTDGFILDNKEDIETTAVLANYSVGLEGIALAEFFRGKGSLLLSGFDISGRAGIDPVADLLLKNMVDYMNSPHGHYIHPLIEAPIRWGEYETEKGMLTGIYSGFMLNSKPALYGSYENLPLLLLRDGHMYGEKGGGWNNAAGKQYVPYGRRLFGPYFHRDFGGVPTPVDMDSEIGKGFFWCRVPKNVTAMNTLVWNPADVALEFKVSIDNNLATAETIKPGEYKNVKNPVSGKSRSVKFEFEGDRRLVVLETSFL
jgi:beta-galactosidase